MRPIVTLLTDFGVADTYVAQMKGVLLSRCPGCQIVDATHQIAPQDVRGGSRRLAEYVPYYPPGTTHIAVVDPGVGTDRRIVAVQLANQTIVLPDNGLITDLWNWAQMLEGADSPTSWHVSNSALWNHSVSSTFHGRDILAPVAAFLAGGGDIQRVGSRVGPIHLLLPLPGATQLPDGFWQLQVQGIDHFGNAWLSVPDCLTKRVGELLLNERRGELSATVRIDSPACLSAEHRQFTAKIVATYGQAREGEAVILLDSQGRLELAVVNGSAAEKFGLTPQAVVELQIRGSSDGTTEEVDFKN